MGEPRLVLREYRRALVVAFVLSAAMNLLMLTGPLFMLLVYDRVLTGRSEPTLAALIMITVFLLSLSGALDHYRGHMLARVGTHLQERLENRAFQAFVRQAEHPRLGGRSTGVLRDLVTVRMALASPGLSALFDIIWTPIHVWILFRFHPLLGWFSLAGVAVILLLAVINQLRTRGPRADASDLSAVADARAEAIRRDIETVRGLGMTSAMFRRWHQARDAALGSALAASDTGGSLTAASRSLRFLLQSAVLGLGAFLVLRNELTPGAMIACSILFGRAVAPVEQVIGHWSQLQGAMLAWRNLTAVLGAIPPERNRIELPAPVARLEVSDLTLVPSAGAAPVLQGISFSAGPGDAVAVIGASAAGKSSLARALANLWTPAKGTVRLGGADLHQYDRDRLARHLGYMPQRVALFDGTVAENIARLDLDVGADAVCDAARMAGAHDMILRLHGGYDAPVTDDGNHLSGGQRQRIALARALYGDPVMLVLDEPSSGLDEAGIRALNGAIRNARAAGKVVVVMSHHPSAHAECNLAIHLEGGSMRGFGSRREMLERALRPMRVIGGGNPEEGGDGG